MPLETIPAEGCMMYQLIQTGHLADEIDGNPTDPIACSLLRGELGKMKLLA